MARRKERVNELIRDILSELIRLEVKDPRVGLVSVTDVEVAQDLSVAKVFISAIGDETAQKEAVQALQQAKGFLRSLLSQRIRQLRHTPELIFREDPSLKTGARVFELLEQVKREEGPFTDPAAGTQNPDPEAIPPSGAPVAE